MKPLADLLNNHRLCRRLYWFYSVVLTVALLWPALTVPAVIPRPDLVVHCLTFGLFSLLFCLGNPAELATVTRTVTAAAVVGVIYGGATEWLQSIPILKRTAAVDDWAADCCGVLCGLIAFGVCRLAARAHLRNNQIAGS